MILAAGEGTRMKSDTVKVLHEVSGRPLLEHVIVAAQSAGASRVVVIVGAQAEAVQARVASSFGDAVEFAVQRERRGTAHAVSQAGKLLGSFDGDVLILCGDVPALPARALRDLASAHRRRDAALSVLTADFDDPSGYGRIVRERGSSGPIREIVEHKDASKEQRAIVEINSGTYCARWPDLSRALKRIKPDNAQGEYYLTDAVRLLLTKGMRVDAVKHARADEVIGVNSRRQLAAIGQTMNRQVLDRLMDSGVTVIDPGSTWVESTVKIGRDSILHPGITLEGSTRVGKRCRVRSGSRLSNTTLGDDVELLDHTVAFDSSVGPRTKVGPFAHLRPGTDLGPDCKIGNFVETKKAKFGAGSKASHLSYLGDASIGKGVNIGAGTITCNYDGVNKHQTKLADGVFIGSDTQLVAPVSVGKGSYVAAGTTVTEDVPSGSLAIARTSQRNVLGWADRQKKKKNKKKG